LPRDKITPTRRFAPPSPQGGMIRKRLHGSYFSRFFRRVICPTGWFANSCLVLARKINPFCFSEIGGLFSPSRLDQRGALAIVTNVGCGMRWTRQRCARNGIAGRAEACERSANAQDERHCCVRRSRVVLASVADAKPRGGAFGPTGIQMASFNPRGDGGKRNSSPGRSRISRKTIAWGMPDVSGASAVNTGVHT
jgi:hypothetical protein